MDADIDDEEQELGANELTGLTKPILVALVAAVAFLAAVVGYLVGQPDAPGRSSIDVGFYQDMTTHHEQAVEMALLELTNGQEKVVLDFAREVLLFQRYELGRMDDSLVRWGASGERPATAMRWMNAAVPYASMPGLATDAEMDELATAQGRASDGLFLKLMAAHHRGGIHMSQYASTHAKDHVVRDLATVMAKNQAAEINEYRTTAIRLQLGVDIPPFNF